MEKTQNIAVFGGTFDPPTLVHEAIIRHCLSDERFDEVWLMPSGARTDKPGMHSDAMRLDLLETIRRDVCNADPRLKVSDFELNLPRPTETIHTVEALEAAYPTTRFWFVYGADSIESMHTWHRGDYLRRHLAILAVPRAGYTLPPEDDKFRYITADPIYAADISSTQVRNRITAHRRYHHMVSGAIASHIEAARLYV